MSKFKLPPSMTDKMQERLVVAWENTRGEWFQTSDITSLLYDNPTTKERVDVSNTLSQFKAKGWLEKQNEKGWRFTKHGEYVYQNHAEIPLRVGPTRGPAKKKPVSEIKPIAKPFTPNLSTSAESLANSLGAVLDDNQAYRDAMKEMLNTLARFLGATITYEGEQQNGSSETNE